MDEEVEERNVWEVENDSFNLEKSESKTKRKHEAEM